MREPTEEEAGEGGGGGVTLILSVGEGGTKFNFCLVRGGGGDLILSCILPMSETPPLQIIIAQSLSLI